MMVNQFQLLETTVDEIHNTMRDGEITSKELVEHYLERIDAYDRHGPELNSVVTINEDAVERAAELDERLETDGFSGPFMAFQFSSRTKRKPPG